MGAIFKPLESLLPGEMDSLLPLGDGFTFLPLGDGCLYLDGTTMAASLATFLFSSRAAARLGTTHLDGTGDADLLPLEETTGDESLSTQELCFFPDETDRCLADAGDENLCGVRLGFWPRFSSFRFTGASACLPLGATVTSSSSDRLLFK